MNFEPIVVGPTAYPESADAKDGGFTLPHFPGYVKSETEAPRRVAVISDIHIPFHDPSPVWAVLDTIESYRPDRVVILGDLYDCYPISRWDQSPDRHSRLSDEFEAGKEVIERIDNIDADIDYLLGNHEDRLNRLLVSKAPGLTGSVKFEDLASIPNRWRVHRPRTLLDIGGLTYLHGDIKRGSGGPQIAKSMLYAVRRSCIFGHFHRTQSYSERGMGDVLWQSHAIGMLASYRVSADYHPVNDWTQSFALVSYPPSGGFCVSIKYVMNGKVID